MKYPLFALSALSLCFLGCGEEPEIAHYSVPKEPKKATAPAPAAPAGSMPGLAAQTEGFKAPTWEAPEVWEAQELGSMRKGSFLVKDDSGQAEISVLVFPGDVGGLLANVNRWAGQIGLAALEQTAVDAFERSNYADLEGVKVILEGPEQDIYGVVLPKGDATWFFKMMGAKATVAAQKGNFDAFMDSIAFED